MGVSAAPLPGTTQTTTGTKSDFWLRDRRWDLLFITFSVIVCAATIFCLSLMCAVLEWMKTLAVTR